MLVLPAAFLSENFGQAHAPMLHSALKPRGRPPAGPYHNTGVAREQKNFELVKLFNDIEGLGHVSTPPHDIGRFVEVVLDQPFLCLRGRLTYP